MSKKVVADQSQKSAPKPRTSVLPSDIDAQGNVVLWDHGPQEPRDLDPASDEYKRLEAEAKEWHRVNGDGPIPATMESGSARHALAVEPARWSLDPVGDDDAEVAAEIAEIQKRREAEAKAAADRAAAIQLAADRKTAIMTVMARRREKAEAEALAAKTPKPAAKPANETGLETAARIAEKKADDDAAAAETARHDGSTPEQVGALRATASASRLDAIAARKRADAAKGAKP